MFTYMYTHICIHIYVHMYIYVKVYKQICKKQSLKAETAVSCNCMYSQFSVYATLYSTTSILRRSRFRMAKLHRMPYRYRSFSAKEPDT